MSYEDFLDLPLEDVHNFMNIIKWKNDRGLPLSDDENEIKSYLIRYSDSVRLERCFRMKSYEK